MTVHFHATSLNSIATPESRFNTSPERKTIFIYITIQTNNALRMRSEIATQQTCHTGTENCIVFAFCAPCAVGACAWFELQSRQCTDNTDAHVQTARKHPLQRQCNFLYIMHALKFYSVRTVPALIGINERRCIIMQIDIKHRAKRKR